MRVHAVRQLAAEFMGHPRLSAFHRCLFHGTATRGGKPLHMGPDVWYSNDCRIPLEIVRAGNYVPNVFEAYHLVISEAVRERIECIPTVEFLPVQFAKLVKFPSHPPGDFSWYGPHDEFRRRDPSELLERLPDVPEYHETIGTYYELLAPRLCDVKDEFTGLREVDFVGLRDPKAPRPRLYTCEVSEELLREYPILVTAAMVLRDDVFDCVRSFIDWEYFLHDELEL